MPKLWIPALLALSGCSSLNFQLMREPASVPSCNRQALGVTSSENLPLTTFNSKRRDAVLQLLQAQLDHLQTSGVSASSERLTKIRSQMKAIAGDAIKPWDEPNEVSYKLRKALDFYLTDASADEKSNGLNEQDLQRLKYARETIEPNIAQLDFWIPEFCQSASGTSSPLIFKGM